MTHLHQNAHTKKDHRQRGISLVIVMIFLVILSVLGISAMQSSTLSSRIARNEADRNLAFQAAEAALRDGELDIRNERFNRSRCAAPPAPATLGCRTPLTLKGFSFDAVCTEGRCGFQDGVSPWETAANWSTSGPSVEYGTYSGAVDLPLVSRQPRYLLESLGALASSGKEYSYRITAVGYGANPSSQVMLQIVVNVTNQL